MAHKFDKTCISETYPDSSVMINAERNLENNSHFSLVRSDHSSNNKGRGYVYTVSVYYNDFCLCVFKHSVSA